MFFACSSVRVRFVYRHFAGWRRGEIGKGWDCNTSPRRPHSKHVWNIPSHNYCTRNSRNNAIVLRPLRAIASHELLHELLRRQTTMAATPLAESTPSPNTLIFPVFASEAYCEASVPEKQFLVRFTAFVAPNAGQDKAGQSQRIAKGAGGKGPRQKSSRHFRQFSRRAKKVKKRQKVLRHFSTIFARHHCFGPFWGAKNTIFPRKCQNGGSQKTLFLGKTCLKKII